MNQTPTIIDDMPIWLTNLIKLGTPAVAILLAVIHPNHTITSPAAQAAVVLVGLLIGAMVHLGEIVSRHGVTKAGLLKSVSDEEAWLQAHASELIATYQAAKPALDAIPGVPGAIASLQGELETVKGAVAAMPDAQRQAVLDVLKGFTQGVMPGFTQGVMPTAVQAPFSQTWTVPAGQST